MAPDSLADASRRRRALLAALTVAVSVVGTIAFAELALRVRHGDLAALPASGAGLIRMLDGRGLYPAAYDETLGYVPEPGAHSEQNIWETEVTIDAHGLRSNGGPRPSGRPILALGDSFTFGDEVGDADTWPAQLERRLGRPVLNAGVFGYGIDQIVLRAERLLDGVAADADLVILNLLPDDVERCEFSYRYSWKPYFELEDGLLALRNVPVPRPHEGPRGEAWWRRALRYSFLGDRLFRSLDPDGWGVPNSVRVHDDGPEVARRLIDRLVTRLHGEERDFLLVIQWHPGERDAQTDALVDRARRRGVPLLELEPVFAPILAERGIRDLFYVHDRRGLPSYGHMNAEGNRVAAEAIADALRSIDAVALPKRAPRG